MNVLAIYAVNEHINQLMVDGSRRGWPATCPIARPSLAGSPAPPAPRSSASPRRWPAPPPDHTLTGRRPNSARLLPPGPRTRRLSHADARPPPRDGRRGISGLRSPGSASGPRSQVDARSTTVAERGGIDIARHHPHLTPARTRADDAARHRRRRLIDRGGDHMDRRQFLGRSAIASAGIVSLPALIAACSPGGAATAAPSGAAPSEAAPSGEAPSVSAGAVDFGTPNTSTSLKDFQPFAPSATSARSRPSRPRSRTSSPRRTSTSTA